jgi:hypothetical protein
MTPTARGFCCGGNGVGAAMLTVMMEMCFQIIVRSFSKGINTDPNLEIYLTTIVIYQIFTRLLPSSLWSSNLLPSWTIP